jgi:hypothetical protein
LQELIFNPLPLFVFALSFHQVQDKEEGANCSNKTIQSTYGLDPVTRKVDVATVSYTAVKTANFDGRGKSDRLTG